MTGILLSGGLDSVALAYWKKPDVAFTINYGQNAAKAEIQASKKICKDLGIQHIIITVDLSEIGSGDLLGQSQCSLAPKSDWWPYRNQLLLTIVCAYIISNNLLIDKLLFGTVQNDAYHKDGTENFFDTFNAMLSIQEGDITLMAPAIHLSSVELIQTSGIPLEKLSWAHSCHKSNYACGRCRGCFKHQNVMDDLGWPLAEIIR